MQLALDAHKENYRREMEHEAKSLIKQTRPYYDPKSLQYYLHKINNMQRECSLM